MRDKDRFTEGHGQIARDMVTGQGKLWGIDRVIGGTVQGKVGFTERGNEGRERENEGRESANDDRERTVNQGKERG